VAAKATGQVANNRFVFQAGTAMPNEGSQSSSGNLWKEHLKRSNSDGTSSAPGGSVGAGVWAALAVSRFKRNKSSE